MIWRKHETGVMASHIWAPELHYIDGKWYIYFAAGEHENIWEIRPYVLECADADPIGGTWTEMGMMQALTPPDENTINGYDRYSFTDFSLDMTTFEHRGRRYCIWAEKVGQAVRHFQPVYRGDVRPQQTEDGAGAAHHARLRLGAHRLLGE